ncbi:glycoside hydrolase family 13 protein [Pseudonocardia yuanmonensis]|uniref:Glycoside hydrolase family 13 protein n=1 Tax=Pseudonocardia yuanmonensis TaxID=1095914 RepID=A0ABP8W244_9PSEU
MTTEPTPAPAPWWRTAVTYQVYLRSFADSNGDGIGDVDGLRGRLPYLADLGVDALWITPWYPSPMADGGYDVVDHRDVDPVLGTLAQADALIAEAHARGIRVVLDLVANHTSDRHPWFTAALAAPPGSPARRRYHFRDGRGPGGEAPPNDWTSAFGGPAWTRVEEPDGTHGQWYLHLFAPQQPDLNWDDPAVREGFDDVVRFWLDRGIDGLRVDAAPALVKAPGLPEFDGGPAFAPATWTDSPHWDVDDVHEVFRRWRKIADGYPGDRMFVAEAVVNGPERLARYLRPGELHTAFNFDYLHAPWQARALRETIDSTLGAMAAVDAPATWVLSNHDETRHVTRFGRPTGARREPADLALGTRRARAAALLMLALPGGAYLYQGEELGLPEVEDLPEHLLQDPTWERSGRTVRGRDGCRVPLPWAGSRPPFGFSPDGARPWLPQPRDWASLAVEHQRHTPGSTLLLYRAALTLRRALPDLHGPDLAWADGAPDVLVFDRGSRFRCVVNLSGEPVPLRGHGTPLLTSCQQTRHELPPDTAAWLTR